MPRDAVPRTTNVGTYLRKRNGGNKWVKGYLILVTVGSTVSFETGAA